MKASTQRQSEMAAAETEPANTQNIPELPPEPPRESLIATAVKFLQNSQVQDSPLEQKRQFLTKKGLTEDEIEIAITRSGVSRNPTAIIPMPHNEQPVALISTWTRIREYSAIVIILGGVVYGLYSLYKKFIEPFLLKRSQIQEEKLEEMEKGLKNVGEDLNQNMQEIRSSMNEMQEQLGEQSMRIGQVAANLTSYKAEASSSPISNSAIGELKAEITSIKGLLLSRNQFPGKPLAPPVIPSWQMKSKTPSEPSSTSENSEGRQNDIGENGEITEEAGGDASKIDFGDAKEEENIVKVNGFSENPDLH